jgi:DNA mismatch repair protein MutS2
MDAWLELHGPRGPGDADGADPPLAPASDLDDARSRFCELAGLELLLRVEAARGSPGRATESRSLLLASLDGLEDLGDEVKHAGHGAVLGVEVLAAVKELMESVACMASLRARAREGASTEDAEHLAALEQRLAGQGPEPRSRLADVPDLTAELRRCIERGTDGGPRIADAASEELAKARAAIKKCSSALKTVADRLVKSRELEKVLQDRYFTERDGRVVLPVRRDGLSKLRGEAIVHGSSGSGQTVFVEPAALVKANNELQEAHMRVAAEERRVRADLSRRIGEHASHLIGLSRAVVHLDHVAARLQLSRALSGRTPKLVASSAEEGTDGLVLPDASHPLMVLDKVEVIANDFRLPCGHALILSGPNAGGKTVALKTVGLCVLLARAGIRLPTSAPGQVPLFSRLYTDVGDEQSISANLSTFTAHMSHVHAALHHLEAGGPAPLVLLDEVAVGTDPEQGAALAESILRELVALGATVIVTTHYDRLKLLPVASHVPDRDRFHNAAVGFDLDHLRPTFRLSVGVPGSSSAIAVARRLGLSETVLGRAEELLGEEGVRVDTLLREIASERAALAAAREQADAAREALATREREVARREKRALEKVASRKQKALDAAAAELHALEDELRAQRKALRRRGEDPDKLPTRGELTQAPAARLERLRAEGGSRAGAKRHPGKKASRELSVGDRVRLRSLDATGKITAMSGERVTVQLANMRTTVDRDDVATDGSDPEPAPVRSSGSRHGSKPRAPGPSSTASRHFGPDPTPVDLGVDNELDLRGTRVEDAWSQVEVFLDHAIARDREIVAIIHGHGSGALRQAVREHLDRLSHVRSYRGGLLPEGGEGVTIVWVDG